MAVEGNMPDYAVPTGEFIAEWLQENGMNQAELSRRLDVSRKHVSQLVSGEATLSHGLAHRLALVTGVEARIWNNYESLYREDLARVENAVGLSSQYEALKQFPLKVLRERGIIKSASKDHEGIAREVFAFFGVASLDAWTETWKAPQAAYRQSFAHEVDDHAIATWLRLGERQARSRTLPSYNEKALKEILPGLRELTCTRRDDYDDVFSKVGSIAAEAGIVVIFEKEVTGARCYGATRWLDGELPVIQLSLRRKTDDHLWFTLFHEVAHILKHPRNSIFIDGSEAVVSAAELEADEWAADLLIPPHLAERMPRSRRDGIGAVKSFAAEIGVSPGVVMGRIQRETGDYGWGNSLKVTFAWTQNDK